LYAGSRVIAAEHRKAFAVDGYAVMPQVIPRYLIVGARAEMKRIVALNPPAPDYRGFHFCFLNEIPEPPARASHREPGDGSGARVESRRTKW
jgi:hypothetical protein